MKTDYLPIETFQRQVWTHPWQHSAKHPQMATIHTKTKERGFPGGAVVKNPPANAGHMGSSPGPGRSHMPRSNEASAPQLLSLCSRACEPQLLRPRATTTEVRAPGVRAPQQEKPPQWEALVLQWRVAPACHNQRKPTRSNKDPTQPKK